MVSAYVSACNLRCDSLIRQLGSAAPVSCNKVLSGLQQKYDCSVCKAKWDFDLQV